MTISLNKNQRGNTLLGLIIGALVGLAVALSVAVYVTKVPIPFLNKNQPRSADTDAAEAKKNKDWDPNMPLAGKNAVKPAPAPAPSPPVGSITPAAPATAITPEPTAPPAAAESAAVVSKPKISSDPLGDLAKAKSEARSDSRSDPRPDTSAASGGADPFSYFIQAGAFRTPEDAEQQRARLSLIGFQAKVTEREQSGRTVYRVRLGPFDKKDDADKAKEKLEGQSIETAMVRVQR